MHAQRAETFWQTFPLERAAFLAFLLMVSMAFVRLYWTAPQPVELVPARAKSHVAARPQKPEAGIDENAFLAARDPLVPNLLWKEQLFAVREVTPPPPPPPPPPTPEDNGTDGQISSIPPKPTEVVKKVPEPVPEPEKPFPLAIKGIIRFPEDEAGCRVVVQDMGGGYHELEVGQEWTDGGEAVKLMRVEGTKAVFKRENGRIHTLDNDLMTRPPETATAMQETPDLPADTPRRTPRGQEPEGRTPDIAIEDGGEESAEPKRKPPANPDTVEDLLDRLKEQGKDGGGILEMWDDVN